ncbi:uncharacterized protein LOC135888651 [Emys orbicularis]|uniref:uncharacterized protein LOC135888651 n=1 Tax=Emys orbicularis TaxID=82168 RepID=UPI0031FDFCB7
MAPLARNVLVTGCNRGIGLELVRQLVESPDPPEHIFATYRDLEGPRGKALQELAAKYPPVRPIQLDAVSLASVRAAVKEVESQLNGKGLNLLINNAAVNSHATLQSVQPEEMISVFTTNVVGPIQVAKFLPLLKRAAEEAGKEGLSCSKAAIINMSTNVGSIELCFKVLEIPMYPYRASKEAAQRGGGGGRGGDKLRRSGPSGRHVPPSSAAGAGPRYRLPPGGWALTTGERREEAEERPVL